MARRICEMGAKYQRSANAAVQGMLRPLTPDMSYGERPLSESLTGRIGSSTAAALKKKGVRCHCEAGIHRLLLSFVTVA